jgi:ribosome-associated protein
MNSIYITDSLSIPTSEIQFTFARSGGKGGQNVNKVETRVELWFDVNGSPSLTESQRHQIREELRHRIDSTGILRIVAQESRSQWRNREDALRRFEELLRRAMMPKKKRVKTKMSAAGKFRRIEEKKHRGEKKRLRRGPNLEY